MTPGVPAGELQHLEQRARSLALEKSHLELVIRLMTRTAAASGVEHVIDAFLQNVLGVLGGTNIVLYYRMDDAVCVRDVYGASTVGRIDDPVVEQVFATREPVEREEDFAETRMATPAFTNGYTWVYPLVAGAELVGVVRMEHLHIGMRDLQRHLPVFFNYAAQILKNEVQNIGRLREAYEEVSAANAALREENLARRRIEEDLRRAKENLEIRVAERTREIREANRQLELELAERRRAQSALSRRNGELAALNRFLRDAASDITPGELLELGGRELAAALNAPYGLARLRFDPADAGHGDWHDADNLLAGTPPLVVDSMAGAPGLGPLLGLAPEVTPGSLLVVPVRVDGHLGGCIAVAWPQPRSFDADDLALATRIGEQAAASLARVSALADSRRLRAAIEQAPDSVMITDETGRIVYVNPAFTAATGYQRAEAVGQNPRLLRSGQHDRRFYEQMWATLLAGGTWHGHLVNRRKNGDLFTEDAIIVPVRDNRGRVANYIALKRDITRELAREEHLRHAQRMESVGELAGGIAHDFNNLLGVMMMHLETMQAEPDLSATLRDGIGEVRKAADRGAKLTRQLLSFGRRQTLRTATHDLNEVVREHASMLARVLGGNIELAFEASAEPLPFSGDASMIEQVLMNLSLNARDAMPRGGALLLSTGAAQFSDDAALPHPDAHAGRFVWLRVTDSGTGMTPDVLEHLFEPFYTTRPTGRGTGLGLATSYGIVIQHHGWIDVSSVPGRGSVFTVYLPWVQPAPPVPRAVAVRKMKAGPATVLLVEDEAAILLMAERCLQRLGYRVVSAPDGVVALRIWAQEGGRVDLLLTDVVMPNGVSGVELTRQLRAQDPALRVVLMSGYPADIARQGGHVDAGVGFLAKPFTLAQLRQIVHDTLRASDSATPGSSQPS